MNENFEIRHDDAMNDNGSFMDGDESPKLNQRRRKLKRLAEDDEDGEQPSSNLNAGD